MGKEFEALEAAVRDFDWHRVKAALAAMKASREPDGANISEEELGKQGYVPGSPAVEGDEAPY